MPFSRLSRLASEAPLRIRVIRADDDISITYAGVLQPLQMAARALGVERLVVESMSLELACQQECGADQALSTCHVILLVADRHPLQLSEEKTQTLLACCRRAAAWGAVGAAVPWLARSGELDGLRVALPHGLGAQENDIGGHALPTTQLFELDGDRLSCSGGAASIDFSLTLIQAIYGTALQADIMETLCVERVRTVCDREQPTARSRFVTLQPKLAEALQLMEANIEEPLATDDIANLVGMSRRQLERQFKQFLGNVPSRYYLELRLQRARQLLIDSHHSIVQVGLMCGFSSGSHFSTAYGGLFGITPREERQRKLSALSSPSTSSTQSQTSAG